MKAKLTPKQFVITSLLNEGASHGYDLEQKIRARGMREWTNIGFSSIYLVLNQLRDKGYVNQKAQVVNGKAQNRFELTPAGKQILAAQIFTSIATVNKVDDPFDVAISNTVGVSGETVHHLLSERIENLKIAVNQLKHKKQSQLENGTPNLPSIMILFDRTIAAWDGEINFLESYKQKFVE